MKLTVYILHHLTYVEKDSETHHISIWNWSKTGHIDVSEDFSNTIWYKKKKQANILNL